MDELLILLFRWIASLIDGDKGKASPTQMEEIRRRMAQARTGAGGVATRGPVPPPARQRGPVVAQQRSGAPLATRPMKTSKPPRRPQPRQVPVAQAIVLDDPPRRIPRPAPAPVAQPVRQSLAVDAAALNRWMTPATLRKQFVLTEILQPPVALRESHLA